MNNHQYTASILTSNIITLCSIGLLYAVYHLAGDYVTTFFFMIIFAIALVSIRSSLIQTIDETYQKNNDRWSKNIIFRLHQAKFGLTFNLLLNILKSIQHPKNIINLITQLFSTSSIPFLFFLYVIIIKLECLPQVLLWDVLFWTTVDLIRLILYPFKKRDGKKQLQIVEYIKTSKLFNQFLFTSVLFGMILILPISIALIYSDIMTYKENLIPKLQKYELPQEYKQYISAEFLLQQLQGQYLSEQTIQQLYSYLNQTDDEGINVHFLEIFYGENAEKMQVEFKKCNDSTYCQGQLIVSNYDLLNNQIYEFGKYGLNYVNAILPQLKQFATVIGQFVGSVFSSSIQFLIKFILFSQGVMYLLSQSSFFDVVDLQTKDSFRNTLVMNIRKHITGVFVSLFNIFVQHFMLSYILLDILNIQLAFIQSFLIGILSLTQIVDPGITFVLISGIWWLAGFINELNHQFCLNDGLTVLLGLIFYLFSGQIYLNTYKQQLGDSFWSAMSVILGYVAFQWQGLIYGPLLVGGVRTMGEILIWYLRDNNNQSITLKNTKQPEEEQQQQVSKKKKQKNQ